LTRTGDDHDLAIPFPDCAATGNFHDNQTYCLLFAENE
jgi:hypothetical protein